MKTYVVIPAYNEGPIIGQVVHDVHKICSNIIVVDDGSDDNTSQTARESGAEVLRHCVNCGQGAALQTGVTYALQQGADIVVMFDADGQHDPYDIIRLIRPIEGREADVVLGSRFLSGNYSHKAQTNHSERLLYRSKRTQRLPFAVVFRLKLALLHQWFFTGLKVTDNHCGLRAFSRSAAQRIKIKQNRMSHASEILDSIARLRISYVEVPIYVRYTEYSMKKGQKTVKGGMRVIYDFFINRTIH